MDLGIAGRSAIICASSRGLGRAGAEALAREGVHVTLNARDAAALDRAVDEIGAAVEEADLADLGELLGTPPRDWQAGDEALERFAIDHDGSHDRDLVRIFHRRLHRALTTLGPEGSAIARHHPVAPLPRGGSEPD